MAVAKFTLAGGHLAAGPVNVVAFGVGIVRATRVLVRRDNAAAGYVETVDDDEAAGGDDLGVHIECYGLASLDGQLGDFMPANESSRLGARNSFQCRSIDHFLDRFDAALHLLGGELELVILAFRKRLFAKPKEPGFEARQLERRGSFKRRHGSARHKDLL